MLTLCIIEQNFIIPHVNLYLTHSHNKKYVAIVIYKR